MRCIHELPNWPNFSWDCGDLLTLLTVVRFRQGLLLGRMKSLGFSLRNEAQLSTLTDDVAKSSAIEGERLDAEEVHSSIARGLGMDLVGMVSPGRKVEGVVEMMLDATQNYARPLTLDRLFDWHACLFPTGRSGRQRITVGAWRTDATSPMQVVSGPFERETVHFEAPLAARLPREVTAFLQWFEKDEQ